MTNPDSVDIEEQVREIITRLFTYGIDWTEYRDSGGPNGDHDVATYASKIKSELANEVANELLALIDSAVTKARGNVDKALYLAEKRGYEKCFEDEKKLLHKIKLCLIGKYSGDPIDNALLEIDRIATYSTTNTKGKSNE